MDSMQYSEDIRELRDVTKYDELREVNFDEILDENELFYIKPSLSSTVSGEPVALYGVFSKTTGIMEADSRQLAAAKSWMKSLEGIAKGNVLPGLGPVPIEQIAPED